MVVTVNMAVPIILARLHYAYALLFPALCGPARAWRVCTSSSRNSVGDGEMLLTARPTNQSKHVGNLNLTT